MKKIISILLAFTMLFSCIGIVAVSAEAEYVEVGTVEDLENILRSSGDRNIIVTRDIIYTCQVNDVGSYWITLGRGEKTLNLNGKSVELNAETGMETTMIRVPSGSSLIINDTSGDNSGKLFCYGRMETPRTDMGPRYFNDTVKHRNVLEVDGGAVTINGGTLEAGRSKKHWIYDGRDVYDLRHMLDYTIQFGVLGLAIGARFDGYAYQQVNGDCITVKDGSLLVNNGIFLGRGFSNLETYVKDNDNDVDVEFSRSACLRLLGGITNINGGTFWGRGNADVLATTKNAKITVKSGTFSTNHLRVLLVPTINVTLTGYWEPYVIGHEQRYGYQYHPASDVGSVRLKSDMLDPQRNTAELNGETLPVSEWAKLNATGNDGSATVVVTHHMSNADRRNFMSGNRTAKTEISRLNIDGTNAYGMTLSPDVLSCDAEGVRSISVEWYHNDEPCDDETTMVAGKYQAKVEVILNAGYVFSSSPNFTIMGDRVSDYEMASSKRSVTLWSKVYDLECNHSYNEDEYLHFDNEKHFMQCSVCGEVLIDEAHEFGDGESVDGAIVYKCRTCDFSYGEADDGKVRIDRVHINIPNPRTGYSPEYFGLISGEGVSFANGGDEFTRNGIRWGLYVNDYGVGEDELFASGMGYRATIFLRADEGYTFSKDQNAQYNPVVVVNGEQAEYETDGELMTVKYEVNTSEIFVSHINITGVDFPEIGEKPDCEIETAEPQYYNVKPDSGAIAWYEDGEYMDKSDTFKAGKEYQVNMYIDTVRSGWDYTARFAENLSEVTLDGFAVNEENINRLNDTTVLVTHTFPVLVEDKVEEVEKPAETEKPTETEKPSEKPSGESTETPKTSFIDVSKGEYYYAPVMWAVENGITSGTSANTFSPDENCTRAQVVTFLHRMVASPEPAAINNPFIDVKSDAYYYKPVMWAVGSKITGGTSDNTFSPDENCTRAQVVTFLWRTAGQPEPSEKKNPFADVKADSYYYDAVLWAVENGITGGTSDNTFSPEDNCTRAQVVTFLYRFINN